MRQNKKSYEEQKKELDKFTWTLLVGVITLLALVVIGISIGG